MAAGIVAEGLAAVTAPTMVGLVVAAAVATGIGMAIKGLTIIVGEATTMRMMAAVALGDGVAEAGTGVAVAAASAVAGVAAGAASVIVDRGVAVAGKGAAVAVGAGFACQGRLSRLGAAQDTIASAQRAIRKDDT